MKKRLVAVVVIALAPLAVLADTSSQHSVEMQQQLQSMSSEERRLFRNMNEANNTSERNGARSGRGGSREQKRYRHREENNSSENRYESQNSNGSGGGYGRGYGSRR